MKYIEHIVEPAKLLLSWQASQPEKSRGRLFVAELIRNGKDADLLYLSGSDEYHTAKSSGFVHYPGFLDSQVRHTNVLSAFMKRLPPRSRADFDKYLTALRIKSKPHISDFALLGYSGAKLPDDNFTLIHTFADALPPFEFLMHVQGYRYRMNEVPVGEISLGQEATFDVEPSNPIDPKAIKVLVQGQHIGYVARGLLESFHEWFAKGYAISANVERINGKEDRPDVYLFLSLKAA